MHVTYISGGVGTFTPSQSIFADEDVLGEQYTPPELLERDEELAAFTEPLMPAARGAQPSNIFVYGGTGAGKSEATRMKLAELESDTEPIDGVDVRGVWQNCQGMSGYQVAVELVNEFRDHSNRIGRGYATREVLQMLWDELDTAEATHVVFALDEIDSLGTDDTLLYHLSRPGTIDEIDTTLSIIGISNKFDYASDLSGRVRSSLCQTEIRFGPYDAPELRTILEARAEKAFFEGALTDDVVPLTAATSAQDSGSARRALDILLGAGRLAADASEDQVTEAHVREAAEQLERNMIVDEIRDMATQTKLVVLAATQLTVEDAGRFTRRELYDRYEMLATRIDAGVKSERTIHTRLSELSLGGFLDVNERNQGERGGRHYTYTMAVQTDMVRDALLDDSRMRDTMNADTQQQTF